MKNLHKGLFILALAALCFCHQELVMESFSETVVEHKCAHHLLVSEHPPEMAEFHPDDPHHLPGTAFNSDGASHNQLFTVSNLKAFPDPAKVPDGWHGIRIYLDFTYANSFVNKADQALLAKYQLSARLTQTARSYFQSALQVNYFSTFNHNGSVCRKRNIPKFSRPIDLYIVIDPENNSATSYVAAALSCLFSPRDKRPITGAYILNFAKLDVKPVSAYIYFSTFAHEFTHILGFSGSAFKYFTSIKDEKVLSSVMKEGIIGGTSTQKYTFIVVPEVVNYARSYFNCPSLIGVPLENEGGAGTLGSHWEKTFLPHEYMNPTTANPGIISEFTFALLRGSGWYRTLKGGAQRFDWGKGTGCKYFNHCPPLHQGTCEPSQVGFATCSADYDAKAICSKDTTYSSGCTRKSPQFQSCFIDNKDKPLLNNEQYGRFSRCFVWTKNNVTPKDFPEPRCHLSFCDASNVLNIRYGDKWIKCTKSGQIYSDLEKTHKLVCPNIHDFCDEANNRCPEDCNGRGICTETRTCICHNGYTGTTCNKVDTKAQPYAA